MQSDGLTDGLTGTMKLLTRNMCLSPLRIFPIGGDLGLRKAYALLPPSGLRPRLPIIQRISQSGIKYKYPPANHIHPFSADGNQTSPIHINDINHTSITLIKTPIK